MRRPRQATGVRRWLGWQLVTTGSLALVTVWISLVEPRFFFAGDKQNQYLPVARDIGRRLRAGEWLPVIDPDLGRSGNYAIDLQYGLFEPIHWVVAIALSYADNLTVAGALWAAALLALFAAGVCALCLRLGVPGSWAAAVAVGVATSGYVLFWAAPSWIPALMSLAWVPWWWWCVSAPGLRGRYVVGSGLTAFLVCAGGWPATWVIWGALVLGVVVEAFTAPADAEERRAARRGALLHVLASAGGGVAALLSVLPLAQAVDYTGRYTGLRNTGAFVPNLADLLTFASPGYQSLMSGLSRHGVPPLFFGVWFVAVVAWLVPWDRSVLRRPGFVAALVALGVCVLVTQAPTTLGALRWPVRVVAGVPLYLGVGVAVALAARGVVLTRGRVTGVLLSLLCVTVLSWFRVPDSSEWVLPSLLMFAAATTLLVTQRLLPRGAGHVALAATVLLAGWTATAHAGQGMVDRGTPSRLGPGALDVSARPSVAFYPRSAQAEAEQWFPQGVASGFLRLTADDRVQPGYSSLGQKGWDERFCVQSAHAWTCAAAAKDLLEVEPTTQRTWAQLLDYRNVVLYRHDERLERWQRGLRLLERGSPAGWVRAQRTPDFVRYTPTAPSAAVGRITGAVGEARVGVVSLTRDTQRYLVSSTEGATLVFRDLYWPGYVATLGGEPLPVRPLDDTLVTVTVPPGSAGLLEVRYEPVAPAVALTCVSLGSALVALAAWLAHRGRRGGRLRRRRSAS